MSANNLLTRIDSESIIELKQVDVRIRGIKYVVYYVLKTYEAVRIIDAQVCLVNKCVHVLKDGDNMGYIREYFTENWNLVDSWSDEKDMRFEATEVNIVGYEKFDGASYTLSVLEPWKTTTGITRGVPVVINGDVIRGHVTMNKMHAINMPIVCIIPAPKTSNPS